MRASAKVMPVQKKETFSRIRKLKAHLEAPTREARKFDQQQVKTKSGLHGTTMKFLWFMPKNWYYLILDASWKMMALFTMISYIIICFLLSCISMSIVDELKELANAENEKSFVVALQFAITNVITMGFGRFIPNSMGAFLLASIQQFAGIILNVIIFSVFITKLQLASPDLTFSTKALITTRDDVPTLLFRIANLRSNFIYMPEIRCSLLRRKLTKEGEAFMKFYPLKIELPPVMTAVATISHVIDQNSPLWGIKQRELHTLEKGSFAISVVFTGRDSVFHDDICATGQYRSSDIIVGKYIFGDTLRLIEGKMRVDFSQLSTVLKGTKINQTNIKIVKWDEFNNVPIGVKNDEVVLCFGCQTRSNSLIKICPESRIVEVTLQKEHIRYVVILIDIGNKPKWFKTLVGESTPAVLDTNRNWLRGVVPILEGICYGDIDYDTKTSHRDSNTSNTPHISTHSKKSLELFLMARNNQPGKQAACRYCLWVLLHAYISGAHVKTTFIDPKNKPQWFLDLSEKATMPAARHGDVILLDSKSIVEYIKKTWPQESLTPARESGASALINCGLTDHLWTILSKTGKEQDIGKAEFFRELEEIDACIANNNHNLFVESNNENISNIWLDGRDSPSLIDLGLMPKLATAIIASKHLSGIDIFERGMFPAVNLYYNSFMKSDVWISSTSTGFDEEAVVIFWGDYLVKTGVRDTYALPKKQTTKRTTKSSEDDTKEKKFWETIRSSVFKTTPGKITKRRTWKSKWKTPIIIGQNVNAGIRWLSIASGNAPIGNFIEGVELYITLKRLFTTLMTTSESMGLTDEYIKAKNEFIEFLAPLNNFLYQTKFLGGHEIAESDVIFGTYLISVEIAIRQFKQIHLPNIGLLHVKEYTLRLVEHPALMSLAYNKSEAFLCLYFTNEMTQIKPQDWMFEEEAKVEANKKEEEKNKKIAVSNFCL